MTDFEEILASIPVPPWALVVIVLLVISVVQTWRVSRHVRLISGGTFKQVGKANASQDFQWACGHKGPGCCKQCRDKEVRELKAK